MGIASSTINVHKPPTTLSWVPAYYGTALVDATHNQALIDSLQYRGALGTMSNEFAIDANGSTTAMYYAYPKMFGLATFLDTQTQFEGGWDGVAAPALGPVEVNMVIEGETIVFYLYETDHTNLGPAANNQWSVYPTVA